MNPLLGWALAALSVGFAWQSYGWQGALFALSVVVFWLLLQFNRSVRVMKNAASAPVGSVDSAVMLNAKLTRGMTMLQILTLTRALGRRLGDASAAEPERWQWTDASGATVTVELRSGRVDRWTLTRDEAPAA